MSTSKKITVAAIVVAPVALIAAIAFAFTATGDAKAAADVKANTPAVSAPATPVAPVSQAPVEFKAQGDFTAEQVRAASEMVGHALLAATGNRDLVQAERLPVDRIISAFDKYIDGNLLNGFKAGTPEAEASVRRFAYSPYAAGGVTPTGVIAPKFSGWASSVDTNTGLLNISVTVQVGAHTNQGDSTQTRKYIVTVAENPAADADSGRVITNFFVTIEE